MGQGAFSECSELKRVLLGDGLKSISDSCFLECGLEEIIIPCGVESIESAAFRSCGFLRKVTFAGNKLETIGDSAFQ